MGKHKQVLVKQLLSDCLCCKIDNNNKVIQGIVIAPTRELAIQTQEELYRLSRDKKVSVQVVYGGADINRQIRAEKTNRKLLSEHQVVFWTTSNAKQSVWITSKH